MKAVFALSLVLAVLVAQTHAQALICAGAAGSSTACAAKCSGKVVNDDVVPGSNQGKFDVGEGNIGDGNDGFNNVGNFNVGNGNNGNCDLTSGGTGGICDPSNSPGQIVLRFCSVYPTDPKCQPSGYLPQYSAALKTQIASVVASCNGGTPLSPPPATASPPPPAVVSSPPPATVSSPPPPTVVASPPPTVPSPPPAAPGPVSTTPPPPTPLAPSGMPFGVSDSTADLTTLLGLFAEHIAQEKASG